MSISNEVMFGQLNWIIREYSRNEIWWQIIYFENYSTNNSSINSLSIKIDFV